MEAAQAALIHAEKAPPSPRHVASLLEKTLIEAGELYKKDAELVRRLYTLSKDVSKGKRMSIQPKELRHLQDQTRDYVDRVQDVVYDD